MNKDKEEKKIKKEASKYIYPPRRLQTLIFRNVNGNRNEIEARKKTDFEHPRKEKKKKKERKKKHEKKDKEKTNEKRKKKG